MTTELETYANGRLLVPNGHFGDSDDATLITVIEDFIDAEDLELVYEYAKTANMDYEGGLKGKMKDRVHTFEKFQTDSPTLFQLFKENYFLEIKNILEEKYGLELTDAFKCTELHKPLSESQEDKLAYMKISSTCGCKSEINPYIVAWTEGTDQQEHKDGSDFTAIIYLNDDYQGGELNFPESELNINPPAGSLIVWPGYLTHGVSPVVSGTRYTMPIFLKAISVLSE
jgi:hypothetical protein